jgi:hypothetical protein
MEAALVQDALPQLHADQRKQQKHRRAHDHNAAEHRDDVKQELDEYAQA